MTPICIKLNSIQLQRSFSNTKQDYISINIIYDENAHEEITEAYIIGYILDKTHAEYQAAKDIIKTNIENDSKTDVRTILNSNGSASLREIAVNPINVIKDITEQINDNVTQFIDEETMINIVENGNTPIRDKEYVYQLSFYIKDNPIAQFTPITSGFDNIRLFQFGLDKKPTKNIRYLHESHIEPLVELSVDGNSAFSQQNLEYTILGYNFPSTNTNNHRAYGFPEYYKFNQNQDNAFSYFNTHKRRTDSLIKYIDSLDISQK